MRVTKRTSFLIILIFFIGLLVFEFFQIIHDQPPITASSAKHLNYQNSQMLIEDLSFNECGVVLTGGPKRIREAIEILAQKKIKKLIISGVFKEAQIGEIFPLLPFYPEINVNDIILEKKSESTYGNAVQSLAVAQSLQCQSILLITSQLHMQRAYKIFKTIYPENIKIDKFYVNHINKEQHNMDIAIETLKSVFYLVFGPLN